MRTEDVITVAGVRSPFLARGPSAAREAVVFVHGNPGPKEDWEGLLERLDPDVRAIAPDMPGYGAADRPRDFDYTVDGYARHLAGLLDAACIDRAHLVLHDFGGPWGLRWAADHLERTASVTLVNTGVLIGYRWHKFARIWQTPLLGELFMAGASRSMLKRMLNSENPRPVPEEFIDRIHRNSDRANKRAVLKLYRATRKVSEMSQELSGVLVQADLPALVVFGAGDPYIPARMAEVQRETFPRAEVHVLDGLGHWPFIDDVERVAALVLPFLRRQLQGAGAVPSK
jgi:pimeloyl-ACP methyl ester carboxylesterase